uniref:Uncharacterized protein n=1 Tax=Anguilla anguilla TaxID=7936 RepID=A0A0E9TBC1_ANGAN
MSRTTSFFLSPSPIYSPSIHPIAHPQ